jgi:hypothetical protein
VQSEASYKLLAMLVIFLLLARAPSPKPPEVTMAFAPGCARVIEELLRGS